MMKKLLAWFPVRKLLEKFPLRFLPDYEMRPVFVRSWYRVTLLVAVGLISAQMFWVLGSINHEQPLVVVIDSKIAVDPSATLSQLIEANHLDFLSMQAVVNERAKYADRAHHDGRYEAMTRLFPLEGRDAPGIASYLAEQGFRPASEDELLVWGTVHASEFKKYDVLTSSESKRANGVDCRYLSAALVGTTDGQRGLKLVCPHLPYTSQRTYVLGVRK